MSTLKSSVLRYGLIIVATIVAFAAIGFYLSRPQELAAAQPAVIKQSPTVAPDLSAAPSSVAPSSEAPSVQPTPLPDTHDQAKQVLQKTVDDIQVEVISTKMIETGVAITVCYTTQDGGDWYPMFSHLFYSTYEIYPDSFEFLSEDRADGNRYGKRCVAAYYKIDELDTITTPIQFGLEELYAVPREGRACEKLQERLDTNPKAKAYGLKMKCSEIEGGTQASVELVGHDQKVDNAKAKKALDDIIQGSLFGPWMFTITEIQK